MNLKVEILTLAIRFFNEKTGTAPVQNPWEDLLTTMFGLESPEERTARSLVEASEKIVGMVKTKNINRKFEKIVEDI